MPKKEKREKQRITFYVDPRHRFIHLIKGNSLILNNLLDRFFGDGDTEKDQTSKLLKAKELIYELKRKVSAEKRPEKAATAPTKEKGGRGNGDGQEPRPAPPPVQDESAAPSFTESAARHHPQPFFED